MIYLITVIHCLNYDLFDFIDYSDCCLNDEKLFKFPIGKEYG